MFGSKFTAPGLHALEFTAAARFEDFLDNDTNVLVPKFGVRWQPFDDSLTVRATWGEGFHEPSLIELFGIPIQGVAGEGLHDPLTKTDIFDVPFIIRSNPNLQPEDSRSFTGGVVYTPKFVPGLTLTIDLYDIENTGRTIIPDFQNVIDRSVTGNLLPGEAVIRDANGDIVFLENAYQNAGAQKARGVNFGLSYQVETRFGTLTWLTQATYLDSFQFAQLPGAPEGNYAAGPSPCFSDEAHLKWRANSQIDWAWKSFDLTLTAHYLDGFHENRRRPSFPAYLLRTASRSTTLRKRGSSTCELPIDSYCRPRRQVVAGYTKDTSSSGKERQPARNCRCANGKLYLAASSQ